MKLKTELIEQGQKLVVKETHDFQNAMDQATLMRQSGAGDLRSNDSVCVGVVPMALFYSWLREAGVSYNDTHAAQEVVRQKLMSGDFSKFRVFEGTY